MSRLDDAVSALRSGRFIMIHDDESREDEVDLVMAAQFVRPGSVAEMRNMAGGMICLAISNEVAKILGLMYMHEMLRRISTNNFTLSKIIFGITPYGDKPSFSISINHIDTYTGITDADRALTISEMAKICTEMDNAGRDQFVRYFRTPGHVPLLIAAKGLIQERMGHTELGVYLMKLANLVPSVVICEMLDSETYKALNIQKAMEISVKRDIPILQANEIKQYNGLKR
ncbi:MAG: 3,4-dihydroxy-2-butanone-4-phosphate synthase [Nitrososphaeraceae archaeon]